MKILLVGAISAYAIERFYLKYLNEYTDITAEIFKAQNIFLEYYNKSIFHKILFRLGYKAIYTRINAQLKVKIQQFHPDILFIFKGMEVQPETIIWAKQLGIKVVNYNPDNPFIFTSRGSGNGNVTDSIGLYDLHFSYNLKIKEQLEREFGIPTVYLPFGFDLSEVLFLECMREQEVLKVCFLGNPDPQRAIFLKALMDKGVQVDVYGSNWPKYLKHKFCTSFPAVYGDEFWKTLYKYRVQLNIMRIHNEDSHNMRSFEIPGVGGIMLAPRTDEHKMFFVENREAYMYGNVEECIAVALQLLRTEEASVARTRLLARERCLQSDYTYKDRTEIIVTALFNLIN